jgi:hypothetical protein
MGHWMNLVGWGYQDGLYPWAYSVMVLRLVCCRDAVRVGLVW